MLRLYPSIAPARAEAVSARALEINAMTYKSVASILNNNLDRVPTRQSGTEPLFDHPNVRGPRYFRLFTKVQNSRSVCQSRPLRERREASMASTAPAPPV